MPRSTKATALLLPPLPRGLQQRKTNRGACVARSFRTAERPVGRTGLRWSAWPAHLVGVGQFLSSFIVWCESTRNTAGSAVSFCIWNCSYSSMPLTRMRKK